MSQCNKLFNIQYARFQILPVDLHFGLFWSAGISTMPWCSYGTLRTVASQLWQ